MAVILVALMLVCALEWDKTSLAAAQTCVDESKFKEQVLYVGQQGPPYQLKCPLELDQPQSSPPFKLTWQRDCQQLVAQEGKAYLEFTSPSVKDQGNYTCTQQGNSTATFTVRLIVKESQCSKAPKSKPNVQEARIWTSDIVVLNCTALLTWDPREEQCDTTLQWSKDGQPLINHTRYLLYNTSSWSPVAGQLIVNSLLLIPLKNNDDYGLFSCSVRNVSTDYDLPKLTVRCYGGSPTAIIILAIVLLVPLVVAVITVVYCKCHLNIKLWYKNSCRDYELNDGKLYDAYISYVNNDHDRKFVNFILKPHLENKNAYKVHLNDNDILPGTEPSAELVMNMSRSRRLIVLLSYAYLEQDWCCNNFRQGLLHLMELCHRPILIMLEGQSKRMRPEIKQQLSEHQHRLTILTWKHNSVTPSSVFWKELALAMPRRVVFHSESAGDPQILLQDDKDPMLALDPEYLDCRSDTDPAGDLGLRLPMYKALACKAPVLPPAPFTDAEPKSSDLDVSDLGSRNYGARSDFYCLVTEEDM